MKDIKLALITRLKTDKPITDLVGTRVYRDAPPPTIPTYPYIIVTHVDRIGGTGTNKGGPYKKVRVQCTAVSKPSGSTQPTGREAENLSGLIYDSLCTESPRGVENMILDAGTGQEPVYVVDIQDGGETPDFSDGQTCNTFRCNHDFIVNYAYR